MAGIRIGTLYTDNSDLVEALAQLGSFHGISGTTQHQVAQLLRDKGMDPCAFAKTMYWENNPFINPLFGPVCSRCTKKAVCWVEFKFRNAKNILDASFTTNQTCAS